MMDPIHSDMIKKIKTPELQTCPFSVESVNNKIRDNMSTKQVIHLTSDEVSAVLDEHEILLPKFLLKYCKSEIISTDKMFDGITDGYQISEYFGTTGIFIPTVEYFIRVKTSKCKFLMNLYNGCNSSIGINLVQSKIHNFPLSELPENYPFQIPESIKYSKFRESGYSAKSSNNKYMFKFPALSVNLPYEYYSTQDIPENIYTWDIDKHQYCFAGKTLEEVDQLFETICSEGIQSPLFMQICQGKIVSASDETYIILLMAKYLKLPTVPATLYMMNNDENNLLISMRPSDIIGRTIDEFPVTQEEWQMANEICYPYFVFHNIKYSNITAGTITIMGKTLGEFYYVANKDEEDMRMEDITTVDYHLNSDTIDKNAVDLSNIDSTDPESIHEKLKKDAQEKVQKDLSAYLESIKNESSES